ncbi:MAG TPA: hypothetical protein VKC66_21665 [Xanthobacteraceae bacterium]|nr:hypothetical protein [Xanthobacteraceae bacterium]
MQDLSNSVGDGCKNEKQDVALVQAILVLSKRPAALDRKSPKYLQSYDGNWGETSSNALRQFQADRVFVTPDGTACQPVAGATEGRVNKGDATWKKLAVAPPEGSRDLRVLTKGKTVHLAASGDQLAASIGRVNSLTFQPAFRARIIALINQIFAGYGMAINVCHDGDRRTFQKQYEILMQPVTHPGSRVVTHAGPGESNHNFGQAADLGFTGLHWLKGDGTVVNDDCWLHKLSPDPRVLSPEALLFFDMLRSEGTAAGLFRGPVDDHPHLQAWSDSAVDMAARLADLLTRSGHMRWTGHHGRYSCDLGFNGQFFPVGSAAQIWNNAAPITIDTLTRARQQAAAGQRPAPNPGGRPAGANPGGRPAGANPGGPPGGPNPARPPAAPAPNPGRPPAGQTPVTQAEVAEMQRRLRADFAAADGNWQAWRP